MSSVKSKPQKPKYTYLGLTSLIPLHPYTLTPTHHFSVFKLKQLGPKALFLFTRKPPHAAH